MDRKYLKVENVQHYLFQNYLYVCLHLLEPEINRGRGFLGFLHLHCTTSTHFENVLIVQGNFNLKGFLPPDEQNKLEIRENIIILTRKGNGY